jgi:uncharacterized integral membrane protein
MKMISGIFGGLILFLVLCFALSNHQQVAIAFWPFDGSVSLPLYIVGFLPLVFGLAFGALWGWLSALPHRMQSRRLHKEMTVLNAKLNDLHRSTLVSSTPVTEQKFWWKRKR